MNALWLIPVDGSPPALRAVDHVLREAARDAIAPAIMLVNVQAPLPSDVTRFVNYSVVQDYHREAGEAALAGARLRLETGGLAYSQHVLVGEPAPTIVNFAREQHCTLIVIGARGLGSVASALLGSVTSKVIHLTELPVLVVK
ncbi:universal stress protein [Candidatus Accumulibacter vicinus]|uniref:Universal stress protein n=1 Tax=Candidatus Accumulibacter vicinus TaxID=2954382 RepID=A0A084XUW7_9PROT|nr:universal stress protein [Candidatus Accumulibacter vicinus]KFB66261.1 MAG: Universal stress protein [Candidatus Accumulibacter vicinus]